MGMSSASASLHTPPQDILDALEQAEEHYASDLSRFADRDCVNNVRAAAVSAALTSVYQTPIGLSKENAATLASHLLGLYLGTLLPLKNAYCLQTCPRRSLCGGSFLMRSSSNSQTQMNEMTHDGRQKLQSIRA